MTDVSTPERLADKHDVTLILRLLVDAQGHLMHGEVGGLEDEPEFQRWVRFRGADGLLGAVHTWLAGSGHDQEHAG